MKPRPLVVAFDVIETVFSLEPLRGRLEGAGLPGATLEVWFAQILRDAFALEVTEVYKPFREIASATLENLLGMHGLRSDARQIAHVLEGFGELPPHPEATTAFRTLADAGIRVVTLTNGGAQVTEKLLQQAGLKHLVERTITVDEIRHWKPRRDIYFHAAKSVGVEPHRLALIAAHAWDVHGAGQAGLTTGFVTRGKAFPATMSRPDVIGQDLADVAGQIVQLK